MGVRARYFYLTESGKEYMRFLGRLQDEEHDAVVYDTGYEFNAESKEAQQYIAAISLSRLGSGDSYLARSFIPIDGSVIALDDLPEDQEALRGLLNERKCNACLYNLIMARRQREEDAEAKYRAYIPDPKRYLQYLSWTHYRSTDVPSRYLTIKEMILQVLEKKIEII